MAALGFKFTERSRTVDYWLILIKQEARPKGRTFRDRCIDNLCALSADLCRELETQALEARVQTPSSNKAVHGGDVVGDMSKRRRGRPAKIPLKAKQQGLKAKAMVRKGRRSPNWFTKPSIPLSDK
jgi:hypothetical protein